MCYIATKNGWSYRGYRIHIMANALTTNAHKTPSVLSDTPTQRVLQSDRKYWFWPQFRIAGWPFDNQPSNTGKAVPTSVAPQRHGAEEPPIDFVMVLKNIRGMNITRISTESQHYSTHECGLAGPKFAVKGKKFSKGHWNRQPIGAECLRLVRRASGIIICRDSSQIAPSMQDSLSRQPRRLAPPRTVPISMTEWKGGQSAPKLR